MFYILQISLKSGLSESSWIFLSASAYNVLQYAVFVEVYEKHPTQHKCVVRK